MFKLFAHAGAWEDVFCSPNAPREVLQWRPPTATFFGLDGRVQATHLAYRPQGPDGRPRGITLATSADEPLAALVIGERLTRRLSREFEAVLGANDPSEVHREIEAMAVFCRELDATVPPSPFRPHPAHRSSILLYVMVICALGLSGLAVYFSRSTTLVVTADVRAAEKRASDAEARATRAAIKAEASSEAARESHSSTKEAVDVVQRSTQRSVTSTDLASKNAEKSASDAAAASVRAKAFADEAATAAAEAKSAAQVATAASIKAQTADKRSDETSRRPSPSASKRQ